MVHLKSEREIEHLRAAADLVSRTLGEVARYVEPGVTTRELDRVAESFITSQGAVPGFKGYGKGDIVFPATLCTSINDELVSGDLVSIDCGVVLDGYYGDSAYTFAAGSISEADAALCCTTYESLNMGVLKAITGNRLGDIGAAIQAVCEAD